MITRLPELPPLDERGHSPHPLVVLAGSAGDWQPSVARELDPLAAAVVRTDAPVQGVVRTRGFLPQAILEGLGLAVDGCDLLAVWIDDGPVWLWLEMAQWIGPWRRRESVWGIKEGSGFHHAGHLRHLLEADGWPVYPTLEDTITVAEARLVELRSRWAEITRETRR